jgi:hypothetical protein
MPLARLPFVAVEKRLVGWPALFSKTPDDDVRPVKYFSGAKVTPDRANSRGLIVEHPETIALTPQIASV